jgi:valyl-tRNA synthetase
MEILVPLSDLIDKDAEIARLEKEIAKLAKNLQGINNKLNNEKFVNNAPAELVDAERERQRTTQAAVDALQNKQLAIKAL